ncbi:hypothetical protein V6N12_017865 [Hibiscus sabdariffa]|uniref:Uncharacterized protein n=1 Tax=Hibiscus sabdariffa TaxID=183260 RepID=A0ABR2AK07_9ROSI
MVVDLHRLFVPRILSLLAKGSPLCERSDGFIYGTPPFSFVPQRGCFHNSKQAKKCTVSYSLPKLTNQDKMHADTYAGHSQISTLPSKNKQAEDE